MDINGKRVQNGLKCPCVLPVVQGNQFFLEGHQNPAERESGGRETGTSSVYWLFAAIEEVKDDLKIYFSFWKVITHAD